jgi:hypothetical protein
MQILTNFDGTTYAHVEHQRTTKLCQVLCVCVCTACIWLSVGSSMDCSEHNTMKGLHTGRLPIYQRLRSMELVTNHGVRIPHL